MQDHRRYDQERHTRSLDSPVHPAWVQPLDGELLWSAYARLSASWPRARQTHLFANVFGPTRVGEWDFPSDSRLQFTPVLTSPQRFELKLKHTMRCLAPPDTCPSTTSRHGSNDIDPRWNVRSARSFVRCHPCQEMRSCRTCRKESLKGHGVTIWWIVHQCELLHICPYCGDRIQVSALTFEGPLRTPEAIPERMFRISNDSLRCSHLTQRIGADILDLLNSKECFIGCSYAQLASAIRATLTGARITSRGTFIEAAKKHVGRCAVERLFSGTCRNFNPLGLQRRGFSLYQCSLIASLASCRLTDLVNLAKSIDPLDASGPWPCMDRFSRCHRELTIRRQTHRHMPDGQIGFRCPHCRAEYTRKLPLTRYSDGTFEFTMIAGSLAWKASVLKDWRKIPISDLRAKYNLSPDWPGQIMLPHSRNPAMCRTRVPPFRLETERSTRSRDTRRRRYLALKSQSPLCKSQRYELATITDTLRRFDPLWYSQAKIRHVVRRGDAPRTTSNRSTADRGSLNRILCAVDKVSSAQSGRTPKVTMRRLLTIFRHELRGWNEAALKLYRPLTHRKLLSLAETETHFITRRVLAYLGTISTVPGTPGMLARKCGLFNGWYRPGGIRRKTITQLWAAARAKDESNSNRATA